MTRRRNPPDQPHRDAAVAERARNVLVDAGAGTGKTALLVERLVSMVAPPAGGGTAIPIGRVAAITFTRKAAGELRLRIRLRLIERLARASPGSDEAALLAEALAGLDAACIGTIHGFADRLLRLRPVEAKLSPSFQIAEDDRPLVRETFDLLLQSAVAGTLGAELSGTEAAGLADEATDIVRDALDAGLTADTNSRGWKEDLGLDALVAGFIGRRDAPPPHRSPIPFDAEAFRAAAAEFRHAAQPLAGNSPGVRWIHRMAALLQNLDPETDPATVLREVQRVIRGAPSEAQMADDFRGDRAAWKLWNTFWKPRRAALRERLLAPAARSLATRLARLFPVVAALHEQVKARHRKLDHIDLLVKLRDLLRDNRAVRGEFQRMFAHIFVDEFQDTDPLQAEIVLFLCEREPQAGRFDEVVLADGKLTLVGDPKQSIYRFRRADVAMYDQVRAIVGRTKPLHVPLTANFRSTGPLIDWFNDRFEKPDLLGTSKDGRLFDPAEGRVFHQPLRRGREDDRATSRTPGVHVLSFVPAGKQPLVDDYRRLEGRVLARYLRWLVLESGTRISDPAGGERPLAYGDIAILAVSTWFLSFLFPALDAEGIPHASRGGTLFLGDPLHRQFILALRALADPSDGVAEAALLRPPFFATDPADLLVAAAETPPEGDALDRARAAQALVRDLRRQRHGRSPGETAQDLLERTAIGRTVARGPNGAQRLARLGEMCHVLDEVAADGGLDYDGATARLRDWIEEPVPRDPPPPVGSRACQVITVHQAKGLEFPVVALWDARGKWNARRDGIAWRVDRDGQGFLMDLAALDWEEPPGIDLRAREQAYIENERRRLMYVAATRARDILIIPRASPSKPDTFICDTLLDGCPKGLVHEMEPWEGDTEPAWARDVGPAAPAAPAAGDALHDETARAWATARTVARRPCFRPTSVSGAAAAGLVTSPTDGAGDPAATPAKPREGRFGPRFGLTVHAAIGVALRNTPCDPKDAVAREARRAGLTDHTSEAAADVGRALGALASLGLRRPPGPDLRLEYPLFGPAPGGLVLVGHADLVGIGAGGGIVVCDFKTDAAPHGPAAEAYPAYADQVRAYVRLLREAGLPEPRGALLFTVDGSVHWVAP